MRLVATGLTLLLSCVAISHSLSFLKSDQRVLDDQLSVPGDNPLKYCNEESTILEIDYVDLTPNPPEA